MIIIIKRKVIIEIRRRVYIGATLPTAPTADRSVFLSAGKVSDPNDRFSP